MKLQSLLTTAAIAAMTSLPLVSSAQGRGRDDNLKRSPNTQSSRSRDDDRRNDRRDDDRRNQNRRNDDRWDRDRRSDDRRSNDRWDNDRWDRNNGHDNGRHNGWDRRDSRTTVVINYNTRHDDWHRQYRSSHRDDCRYDSGNWRQYDTRYNRYDDGRYDNYGRYDDYGRYGDYGRYDEYRRREETSREWRSLASLGGLLSIIGLLNNDDTLVFAGAAGALYSEYRYQQDKRSQDRIARGRAYYFDQPYFYRDGRKYERRTVTRSGQRYFQFVRCD